MLSWVSTPPFFVVCNLVLPFHQLSLYLQEIQPTVLLFEDKERFPSRIDLINDKVQLIFENFREMIYICCCWVAARAFPASRSTESCTKSFVSQNRDNEKWLKNFWHKNISFFLKIRKVIFNLFCLKH